LLKRCASTVTQLDFPDGQHLDQRAAAHPAPWLDVLKGNLGLALEGLGDAAQSHGW
jgi:hypothetical protein